MGVPNYILVFNVRCQACEQVLEPTVTDEGVEHAHGNPADCSEPSVMLPLVSVEQLSELLAGKKKTIKAKASKKGK